MHFQQNLCPNCFEAITNPICDNCLMGHFRYWLKDLPADGITKSRILKGVRKVMTAENLNKDSCILCGIRSITICPYCFSLKVASRLRAMNLPENTVSDFEYSFTDKFYLAQEEEEYGIRI